MESASCLCVSRVLFFLELGWNRERIRWYFSSSSSMCSCHLRRPLVTHHCGEFLVADPPVSVEVRLADHLVDLLLGEVLAEGGHHLEGGKNKNGEKEKADFFPPP